MWCHRWEYDKNPEEFFTVAFNLADKGVEFDLMAPEEAERVREIFGGPIEPLSAAEATATLKQVNALLMDETGHHKDALGNPGGVQELPDNVSPILVGDLHARVHSLELVAEIGLAQLVGDLKRDDVTDRIVRQIQSVGDHVAVDCQDLRVP